MRGLKPKEIVKIQQREGELKVKPLKRIYYIVQSILGEKAMKVQKLWNLQKESQIMLTMENSMKLYFRLVQVDAIKTCISVFPCKLSRAST